MPEYMHALPLPLIVPDHQRLPVELSHVRGVSTEYSLLQEGQFSFLQLPPYATLLRVRILLLPFLSLSRAFRKPILSAS